MFHYMSCGLQDIWLRNGYTEIETKYGEALSIHNIKGLHKTIGLNLINNKPKLSGDEIRFLRKELDLSQAYLAILLGVSESSIRAWESNRTHASPPAEKMIRLMYEEKVNGNKDINKLLEKISQLSRDTNREKFCFEETSAGWKEAA